MPYLVTSALHNYSLWLLKCRTMNKHSLMPLRGLQICLMVKVVIMPLEMYICILFFNFYNLFIFLKHRYSDCTYSFLIFPVTCVRVSKNQTCYGLSWRNLAFNCCIYMKSLFIRTSLSSTSIRKLGMDI